jgi:hypothetical protein
MNPRRARRELWREMGFDKHSQQPRRELSPEEVLQQELRSRHPDAKHKTVVTHVGKWYQCRWRPVHFSHGIPTWQVTWIEVAAGVQGPAQQKPLSDIAKAFSRGKKPADQ